MSGVPGTARQPDVAVAGDAVAVAVAGVRAGLGELAGAVVHLIESEVPPYRRLAHAPFADRRDNVVRNLDAVLTGVAARRGPTLDELEQRRPLGRVRARQGIPAEAIAEAYQVAAESLWEALVRACPDGGEPDLVEAAPHLWRWAHEVAAAVVDEHAEEQRDRHAELAGARGRLVDLLGSSTTSPSGREHIATAAGFDPLGTFAVVLARTPTLGDAQVGALQRRLDAGRGVHAVVHRGAEAVVVAQPRKTDDLDAVRDAVLSALPDARVGVGLLRVGLDGARASLRDARLAAALAPSGSASSYETSWLWAELRPAAARLAPLLSHGVEVAREHEAFAATVAAYAESGFSVADTARALDLHPNTVSYRLERWLVLTGWDPRTFDGLARSLAAVRGARQQGWSGRATDGA